MVSAIQEQHDLILETIKQITAGDWKILLFDEKSKKLVDNVLKEDDFLNHNIANIERIEERRDFNPSMDAIYIVSPEPHIVDCVLADLEVRRYRNLFLVWTMVLDPQLRRRIDGHPAARQLIAGFQTLSADFYPRESHLVTFRDPWSFPVFYHPACNGLIRKHMQDVAQKVTGLCVALGEYPKVRYFRSQNAIHEASVLCSHLARFISDELDDYAQYDENFPPVSSRPQGVLVITDRSMDLFAPLMHEFTYQAMVHDLLPIKDGDKTTYRMTVNEGTPDAEDKDMELTDKDKVWVDNRHRHMKDTIDKLMGDFQKFLDANPHFTNEDNNTTINAIKDMMAGLPQFQETKEAYSLHLTMAQECMNIFQNHKLNELAPMEQTMATGLDEDYRKPKNVLENIAHLLGDPAVQQPDRLRLIMMYIMYRDGVIPEDIKRLLAHAGLQDDQAVPNLELLGGKIHRGLKEPRREVPPLFSNTSRPPPMTEDSYMSRFDPAVKTMLENLCRGTLDQITFPYVKTPADPNEEAMIGQGSLRAAKPSWAGAGRRVVDNKQRIMVFMAGGATFSESRSCYEVGQAMNRDVFLVTSHMLTPQLFVRQLSDLTADKRRLDLPMERPPKRAPPYLLERPAPPQPPPGQRMPPPGAGLPGGPRMPPGGPMPPTNAMGNMSLNPRPQGTPSPQPGAPRPPPPGGPSNGAPGHAQKPSIGGGDKPHKLEKEKKKRNIFGMKKS